MLKPFLEHAGLVLGIVLSIYTVYQAIDRYVTQGRERRALTEELRLEFEVYLDLAEILRLKVDRFYDRFPEASGKPYDQLSTPQLAEIESILVRAKQVLDTRPEWDLPRIAAFLDAAQMDALIVLLDAHLLHRKRLELRLQEFLADRQGYNVWGRFLASAGLDDVQLADKFVQLRIALGTMQTG